jgi:DNA topoisomerase-3
MKTTYRLALAEKPSVAASIAAVLGAEDRKDGFFIGNGWLVSWCLGHLVELAAPGAYGEEYKRWNRALLPILPEVWKYTAAGGKRKQLDILRALLARADVATVVNACDAGREGEFIFRLVYRQCKCRKPVQRLWISSLEDAAIRDGFANLRPGADCDHLYRAALCRAQADWLVGINATRLFSCLYGATLTVGRVQSPTLALLVEREAAIHAFTPEAFYTPVIDIRPTKVGGSAEVPDRGAFAAAGERQRDAAAANAIRAAAAGQDALVLSVEKTRKTAAPPKLFDLTSLQREANRLLGFTAKQTLDYAQALYEKKLITYPRTDSRFLTDDMAEGLGKLVSLVAMRLPFVKAPLSVHADAVIDGAKVSDHHAIIPTMHTGEDDFSALPSGERDVLRMVIARLVCATAPVRRFETVTAVLECGGHRFTAKGRAILEDGWKSVDAAFCATLKNAPGQEDSEDEENGALPALTEGQVFPSIAASVREGSTKPPARYTEGTLLRAMETAGDGDFPDGARRGLGTPATRAAMIEKLIQGGCAERHKKQLVPTDKGKNLIAILPEEIKSPLFTAEWEQKLKAMERGTFSDVEFMGAIVAFTRWLVASNAAPLSEYASRFSPPPKGAVIGQCPRCNADVTEVSPKGFFCSNRACKFAFWKDSRFWAAKDKTLDKTIAAALLKDGRVHFADLKSKRTGKTYAATVVLEDADGKVNFKLEFENNGRKSA